MTKRRWLIAAGIAWILVLAVTGTVAARTGEATVKEQRDIAQAAPVVDRAVGAVLRAAGASPAATVSPYQSRRACKVNAVRDWADYERVATLYTRPGTELGLLTAVRDGLPKTYAAKVDGGKAGSVLSADAGEFVRITGTAPGPGIVRVTAYTGCRPDASLSRFDAVLDRGPLEQVLAQLGATASSWDQATLDGVVTVTARATGVETGSLAERLGRADALISTPALVVYRDGAATVVVTMTTDTLTVARTTQ